MKERQNQAAVLRAFAFTKTSARRLATSAAPRFPRVSRFTVGTLYSTTCGNTVVEHRLHDSSLIGGHGQTDAVTLPVRTRPRRLAWQEQTRNSTQSLAISRCLFAAPVKHRRKTAELLTPDGSL